MKTTERNTIKGIIFDLDGTLIDSYTPIMESLNHVRQIYGLNPYSLDEVKRMVGRGLEVLIAHAIGEEHVEEGVKLFREMYRRIFLEKTMLMPDAEDVIRSLARKNYIMSVTSNKPSYFTIEILKAFGIHEFFNTILGPDNTSKAKPDPEMVEVAIRNMGLDKNEVVYVGDMTIDIETCKRAGIKVFAIGGGSSTLAELERAAPDMLFNNLQEIDAIL